MPATDSHRTPLVVMPIFGTRPEAVKMAPLVNLLKSRPQEFRCVVGVTAQHRQILDQVLEFFAIKPDYDLNIMQTGQTLTQVTTRALEGLEGVLQKVQPDIVLAQGDTTTVLAAAMAAAYQKIAFGHVEAGLRTDNKFDPFPEEINRRLTGQLTDLHFAPTQRARENLLHEGIKADSIYLTGNTVIDALHQVAKRVHEADTTLTNGQQDGSKERILLVTTHRRENWGAPLEEIAGALHDIVEKFPDTRIILPMHPNPTVREPLQRILGQHPRVELIEPQDYVDLVRLMEKSHLVLTDSGGVQEEAPALGLPVLVLRRTTERPEGVDAGTAKLVGTRREDIVQAASVLLGDQQAYEAMSRAANPYGDGHASERIAQAILHWAGRDSRPDDFTIEASQS
ncbi:MAG: UDP-N-acetylglucosamine 2-epimerase (non-hydrolyzing) [Abitibacteriaceae bacterium]|nr:UDP-N-acetylglucosamine 2-epimerase (non-hydrolyzing) [Abditibacteriaceae bacterium]